MCKVLSSWWQSSSNQLISGTKMSMPLSLLQDSICLPTILRRVDIIFLQVTSLQIFSAAMSFNNIDVMSYLSNHLVDQLTIIEFFDISAASNLSHLPTLHRQINESNFSETITPISINTIVPLSHE